MWNYKQDDIMKEIGSAYLEQSGCYKGTIKKVTIRKGSDGALSRGLKFEIEVDETIGQFELWYIDKNGKEMYSVPMLNQLCFMLKLNPSKFTVKEFVENNKPSKKIIDFEGKKIGVFLEHFYKEYKDKIYKQFNCKGFFNPATGKTTSEEEKCEPAKKYEFWEKRFEEINRTLTRPQKSESNHAEQYNSKEKVENDGDFPF